MPTPTRKTETEAAPRVSRAIPKTMQAAAVDRFGGPEELKPHTLPVPTLDANQVLIALHTAGVGSWDAAIRGGWWPGDTPPKFPLVLGTDGAGTVAATGSSVHQLKPGDRVYSYSWVNPKGGFHAEYVAVVADKVAPIPTSLDLERAGAIPTTGLTALQGVDDVLHVKKGETIVIHGASGGVGTLAVQFAKLRGARVFATASGDDGVALVRRLGADTVVDGRSADITAAARQFAPDGVDAVLAFAGGEGLERCLDAVRPDGRLAYPNGVEPAPRKRRNVKFSTYNAVAGALEFERLNQAVDAAKLEVPIAAQYALADAAQAHEYLDAGHVLGKVVLRIR